MPISDYSEAELQPRNLTTEEIENPEGFISEFFTTAHLPQWREILWYSLRRIVIGDFKNLPIKEKADLISYYEKIAKLVETAYVIEKRKETIENYAARNTGSRKPFAGWLTKTKNADWKQPADIQDTFPHADLIGNGSNRVVFDIGGQ